MEVCSCKRCYSGKAISITYSECVLWPASLYKILPHYLINGTIFSEKVPEYKICVLIISITVVWLSLQLLSDYLYNCCVIISTTVVWLSLQLLCDYLYNCCLIISTTVVWLSLQLLSDYLYNCCLIISTTVVWLSLQLLSETFLIVSKSEQDMIKNEHISVFM